MVKHTQTIRQPMNCLGVFNHFMESGLKEVEVEVHMLEYKIESESISH